MKLSRKWVPEMYLKFEAERMRPALDLLEQVRINKVSNVADLGCGNTFIIVIF
jgi:trans-aconitate 2-methyltransferase